MTTSPPPPSSDDELVSAVLDGGATAEERSRVLADPLLEARLQEMAAVRDAVGSPVVPLPPAAADRLIDVALAATTPVAAASTLASAPPSADAPPPPTSAPVSLDAARERRSLRRRGPWGPALLGVAALLLVGLVAVPLLGSLGDDGEGEQTAAVDVDDGAAESADGAGAGADAAGADDPGDALVEPPSLADEADADEAPGLTLGARPQPAPVDLGSHPELGALADAAADAAPVPVDSTAVACTAEPAGDRLVLLGVADLAGQQVLVEVWWTVDSDDALVQVLDPVSCDVIAQLSRPG